jgi:hypothetical protein
MLPQMFYRRDTETQRLRRLELRDSQVPKVPHRLSDKRLISLSLRLWVSAVILLSVSCGSKPTDLRTVVPADSLVYLETNDLGKAIRAVTENDSFKNAAKATPDLSVLNGIKLAVAVTGFETKEEQLTEENSVLNFQPRFVAVAETNAWNYQAISFAENQIGEFINEIYGGEVELVSYPKHDGKYFVWTAQDGRKAYGLVIDSLIFFGNDESAIEKCIAVRKGEADPIAKNSKLPTGDLLSSGYVSPEGVGQLANIAGIQLALGSSQDEDVLSAIAVVLPKILRNSVTEITWTSKKIEHGIQDEYLFGTTSELGQVFSETLITGGAVVNGFGDFIPSEVVSGTRYDLKDAQIAWRSVLLAAGAKIDDPSADVVAMASLLRLLDPYGVANEELFLSAIGNPIFTLRFDDEGENVVVISNVRDVNKLKQSIDKEIKSAIPAENINQANVWRSQEGTAFAIVGDKFLLGDAESVIKCLNVQDGKIDSVIGERLSSSDIRTPGFTVTTDSDPMAKLVEIMNDRKDENTGLSQLWTVSTEFKKDGIHRREVSNFGLLGSIIEQFGKD